jgi:hypothetical protein
VSVGWRRIVLAAGIAAFVLAAIIGHFASHPAYSSITHSVSELAGQNMPNAWIMRAGFVAFGGTVLIVALADLRATAAVNAALCVFGAGMIGSAIWSHVPIREVGGGSQAEDDLHSIAASVMGAAFAVSCAARFWTVRMHVQTRGQTDWFSAFGVLIAVIIPLLMFQLPTLTGALQRGMFAFSFVWFLWVTARPAHPVRADSVAKGGV